MTRKISVHVQYRCNHHWLTTYIPAKSDNFFPNIFDPWLVESVDVEPMSMEGQPYSPHFTDEEIGVEQFKSWA